VSGHRLLAGYLAYARHGITPNSEKGALYVGKLKEINKFVCAQMADARRTLVDFGDGLGPPAP
jgi:hypothetical protein